MALVHSKCVLHRDLKPGNVLLDGNFEVWLADFGLSKVIGPGIERTNSIGTPIFMAPELNYEEYSYPVDVFAYTVTVYATFTNQVDLTGGPVRNPTALLQRICAGERFKRPAEGSATAIPDRLWELIEH
jgi:serine/threonine protein kinase